MTVRDYVPYFMPECPPRAWGFRRSIEHRISNIECSMGKDEKAKIRVPCSAKEVCFSFEVGRWMFDVRRSFVMKNKAWGLIRFIRFLKKIGHGPQGAGSFILPQVVFQFGPFSAFYDRLLRQGDPALLIYFNNFHFHFSPFF